MVKTTKNCIFLKMASSDRVPLSDVNKASSCCHGKSADVDLGKRSLYAKFYPYRITL